MINFFDLFKSTKSINPTSKVIDPTTNKYSLMSLNV